MYIKSMSKIFLQRFDVITQRVN